jgi:hypothetical protein
LQGIRGGYTLFEAIIIYFRGGKCHEERKPGVKGFFRVGISPSSVWNLIAVCKVAQAYFSEVFFGMIGACLRAKALTAGGSLLIVQCKYKVIEYKLSYYNLLHAE